MAISILFLTVGIITGIIAGVFIASVVIAKAIINVDVYGYYEFDLTENTYRIEKK